MSSNLKPNIGKDGSKKGVNFQNKIQVKPDVPIKKILTVKTNSKISN